VNEDRAAAVYDAAARAGAERKRLAAEAERQLDAVVTGAVEALEAGVSLNLTEIARRAGLSRTTLYDRLPRHLLTRIHEETA
jgi:transcriptional regulator of acetoin/glycerol metabolism